MIKQNPTWIIIFFLQITCYILFIFFFSKVCKFEIKTLQENFFTPIQSLVPCIILINLKLSVLSDEWATKDGGICQTSKINMQAFLCDINTYVLVDLCAWETPINSRWENETKMHWPGPIWVGTRMHCTQTGGGGAKRETAGKNGLEISYYFRKCLHILNTKIVWAYIILYHNVLPKLWHIFWFWVMEDKKIKFSSKAVQIF